jgi:hypothetical protein
MSDSKKKSEKRGPGGSEKKFIPDMEQVEKLCRLNCTDAELAAYFGFCRKTIERERKINPEFDAAIERGKSYGKLSLRRKQVALAEEGNATMLIWLGKQYMGQRDKNELTGADGGPMEHDHTWTVKVEE